MEERKQIKKHLDKELESFHFTKQKNVLKQLNKRPVTLDSNQIRNYS